MGGIADNLHSCLSGPWKVPSCITAVCGMLLSVKLEMRSYHGGLGLSGFDQGSPSMALLLTHSSLILNMSLPMDKQEDSTIPWRSLSQNVLEMEGKYERRHRRLTVEFSHGPSTVLLGTHVS